MSTFYGNELGAVAGAGASPTKQTIIRVQSGVKAGAGFQSVSGSRAVVLSGTATFNQIFGHYSKLEPTIRTWLGDLGFDVIAVRVNKSSLGGSDLNLELELNVFNNYTAEEARQSVSQALASITRQWITYYYVLTNVKMQVVSDFQTTITQDKTAFVPKNSTPPPNNQPAGNSNNSVSPQDLASLLAGLKVPPLPDGKGFFDNLGASLGISTPIAIAGIVLVVLIMKKF